MLRTSLTCLLLLALSPLGAVSAADVSRVDGESVRIDGAIDAGAVRAFTSIMDGGTHTLVISSPGGSAPDVLDIAEEVARRKMKVVVDGRCFSGCASHIFVAAAERMVKPDSIVGFHNTMSSFSVIVGGTHLDDVIKLYQPLAKRERALYESSGVSLDLLVRPQQAIGPLCFVYDPKAEADRRFGVATMISLWVPTRKELADFGVDNIAGFWPDAAELGRIHAAKWAGKPNHSMIYGRHADPRFNRDLASVVQCSPEFLEKMGLTPPRK